MELLISMKLYYFVIFLLLFFGCKNTDIKDNYLLFNNKKIIFPSSFIGKSYSNDSICIDYNKKLKIVNYIDTLGCISCKSQLPLWRNLISFLYNLDSTNISFLFYVHPKTLSDAKVLIGKDKFEYPVIFDLKDSLNKLNHFPSDERFHCFLLDENNRVILIGNPVQNPKIKELYIRTICERLAIDTTNIKIAETQKENSFSFGRFSYLDTMKTQFVLRNDSLSELKIDSIFTSCECTTAKIDKSVIKKSDSAIISIAFKTDKPEEFMREVYVKTNSNEKPIVYTIEGLAY
ncbi:MAG: DUF1573 domain-containing protein [Bacteroidales bacterium]|nr:DUF1573 domain-containing protein [Bacteroidales bacterium]